MKDWDDESKPLHIEKIRRRLSKTLENRLNKKFHPLARIDGSFRGNDITFFTNDMGEPVTLFIGRRKEDGNISGECYTRRIKEREGERIIQSHWDNKGKVTGNNKK